MGCIQVVAGFDHALALLAAEEDRDIDPDHHAVHVRHIGALLIGVGDAEVRIVCFLRKFYGVLPALDHAPVAFEPGIVRVRHRIEVFERVHGSRPA